MLYVHPLVQHVRHPGRWVDIGVAVGDRGLATCLQWPTYPACARRKFMINLVLFDGDVAMLLGEDFGH